MDAVARKLAGHSESAAKLLVEIRNRWPEWHPAWVVDGIVLYTGGHFEEAHKSLEMAAALGARGPEVSYYLDRLTSAKGGPSEGAPPYLKDFLSR